jgi:hypothetical protein
LCSLIETKNRIIILPTTKETTMAPRWNDDSSDDGYDAMKDAYHEGWGRPYNERTRREVQDEIDNDKEQGW